MLVKRLGRGTRGRPQLVTEEAPEPVVDRECLGGVPSRLERPHQESVAALAERRERDERAPAAFGASAGAALVTMAAIAGRASLGRLRRRLRG